MFNAEQCDGLPSHCYARPEPPSLPLPQRIASADQFFAATGATICNGGNRATARPAPTHIQMPRFEAFRDAESYAATLAVFGGEGYAREELVTELGSAFVCGDPGITPEVMPKHVAYRVMAGVMVTSP